MMRFTREPHEHQWNWIDVDAQRCIKCGLTAEKHIAALEAHIQALHEHRQTVIREYDERIAALEATADGHRAAIRELSHTRDDMQRTVDELMAENARLQGYERLMMLGNPQARVAKLEAQNARMRAVVEAVAEAGVGDEYGGGSWLMFAGYDAETIRRQARAILASASEETTPTQQETPTI